MLTVSFQESGRSLFPGSGFVDELGEGSAAGTSVNVPFEPMCGPDAWLGAVRALVPTLAAAFGSDIVVSQHGADGHVWDPLAHLCLTTTVMGEAARLVDRLAHRHAAGRWLATGGGGYAMYRVVPRAWALTWLAGAHREVPRLLPGEWVERWAGDAERWEGGDLPRGFEDEAGVPDQRSISEAAAARAERTVELVRTLTVPALLRTAERRGWWAAEESTGDRTDGAGDASAGGTAEIVAPLTGDLFDRVRLAARTIPPADAEPGLALLRAAIRDGAVAAGAVSGEWLVGVAMAAPVEGMATDPIDELVALGVAPVWRRQGIAAALLRALVAEQHRAGRALVALHTAAERDPFDPLPREVRRSVAERLFGAAGWRMRPAPPVVTAADPGSFLAVRLPPGAPSELVAMIQRRLGPS